MVIVDFILPMGVDGFVINAAVSDFSDDQVPIVETAFKTHGRLAYCILDELNNSLHSLTHFPYIPQFHCAYFCPQCSIIYIILFAVIIFIAVTSFVTEYVIFKTYYP